MKVVAEAVFYLLKNRFVTDTVGQGGGGHRLL
ncbi:hypothetical protein JOC74_002740 [Bacillus capparidis]|uniref:Uncharacterized protein n=1 Tax=Bacillus capparidis TaxID=1840411 RepID=A0ABS4CY06_9BACI|nr:hypothetical protein [Bacillus capparidis]